MSQTQITKVTRNEGGRGMGGKTGGKASDVGGKLNLNDIEGEEKL
jgi:hypothetical protein